MDGKGILKMRNGDIYEGEFKNDKRDGYGVFKWHDGRIFKGSWKEGKQHGEGVYLGIGSTRMLKKGIWEEGKRIKWIKKE